MTNKNQNSTKNAENVSFPEENLQVTENGGTFASSEEQQETKEHGRYVSPIVDYNMEDMTTPLAFQDEMPIFKRLATVAEYANMTPAEQARYDYELKQYRDHYAQMSWATKKGLMEGEAKGFAKGAVEERRKNAIALKKQGVSSEIIASALGMSIEEVDALQ